jgi:integrase
LNEALSLRVKDVDFHRREISVREAKGGKDRVTMLPEVAVLTLRRHIEHVKRVHKADLAVGLGRVPLPSALGGKYPNAEREWAWQWVFPASSCYEDRATATRYRYHVHPTVVQKGVRAAADRAPSPNTSLRTRCATRLLRTFWRTATTSAP